MVKKFIAVGTLTAFLSFSWACIYHTVMKQSWEGVAATKPEKAKIVSVQKKSGEYISFSPHPARVRGRYLVGEKRLKDFEILAAQVKRLVDYADTKGDRIRQITTLDGKSFNVISFDKKGTTYLCEISIPETVPLSDIDLVWVQTVNKTKTVLVNAPWVVLLAWSVPGIIITIQGGSLFF